MTIYIGEDPLRHDWEDAVYLIIDEIEAIADRTIEVEPEMRMELIVSKGIAAICEAIKLHAKHTRGYE